MRILDCSICIYIYYLVCLKTRYLVLSENPMVHLKIFSMKFPKGPGFFGGCHSPKIDGISKKIFLKKNIG